MRFFDAVSDLLCVCVCARVSPTAPTIFCSNDPRTFASVLFQMQFLLLFSRQGKLRLQKWFTPLPEREKKKVTRDMMTLVLGRPPRSCNFVQWRDLKIVYRRWDDGSEPLTLMSRAVFHRLDRRWTHDKDKGRNTSPFL